MAIRIRKIKEEWVALCAAKSTQVAGDIYLDDGMHQALTKKFEKDFRSMGFLNEKLVKNNVDIIGCALVKGSLVGVTVIDESRLQKEGVIRVMWVNKDGKRVTSFVEQNEVKKYNH